jgi:DNA-binding CsgD family transcriptional regulator
MAQRTLTPQEQRVARLVAEGRRSDEVAGVLSLSVRTVDAHLARVYRKLGVHSRTELAALLRPHGPLNSVADAANVVEGVDRG